MLDGIVQRLEQVASRSEIDLDLDCAPAMVTGVPRLVDELAYNLTSNAIRYNHPGGSVTLSCGVEATPDCDCPTPFIRVADTGIG
ncbi:MAG: two-component sensor histidine kinase, partial [Collinsella intestinalis]